LPITAANIRFQDYQFTLQTATGTWRWTTRMDVSGSVPAFEVRDVITPYGTLRDNTPIPGTVVEDMAASIVQIQSNFPPNILMGPPPDLTFEMDEGRGFSAAQSVIITNDGVFGSLLGVVLSASASYVTSTPASVGNLASNEAGSFDVSVTSTDLVAVDSPYSETIVVQDVNATNSPQTFVVTINVRPKATIQLAPTTLGFSATKPVTGPFPVIPTQTFDVTNSGPAGSILDFQVQKLTNLSDDWFPSFGPVLGTLTSGQSQTISVVTAPIESLTKGTYQETLRVSGYSTNEYVDILVQLVIS